MANRLKQLDADQVIRSVYDPDSNSLNVNASISMSIGVVEVIIDHKNDSIRRRLDADDVDFEYFTDYDLKITDPEFDADGVYDLMY